MNGNLSRNNNNNNNISHNNSCPYKYCFTFQQLISEKCSLVKLDHLESRLWDYGKEQEETVSEEEVLQTNQ